MGLFGIGKKNKKNSSFAPAKKTPKDILSFEDHVNGAHAVMAAQDTEEFDPKKFPENGRHLTEDIKKAFGEVSGEYTYNKYGYVLNKSRGLETPPEEFYCFKNKYGYYRDPTTLLSYLKKEKHEVLDTVELPGAHTFNEKHELVTDWSKFQKKLAVHTFYWYQLPAAEAVSVTADEKTGEIIFQDKLGRTQQMIVAQYDERRQGFSSVKIYDTQKRYLAQNFINLSYSIDWDAEIKTLKEWSKECVERFGSLFGHKVLRDMEYFDLGRNKKPNGYVDVLGRFDTPEEFLKKTIEELKLQKYKRGIYVDENNKPWIPDILRIRRQFLVDTPELAWILVNYVIPQFEMDNRDQRAYQNYVDTIHSIREQCNADMQKRHPGYRIPEDGANGDMQHLQDIMYCNRVNEEIEALEDAQKTADTPAGSIGEKIVENKEILRQIQDLALRYAKGTMTKLEEEEDRRMRAERAVAKILNEGRSND